jgi:hypothetical protein
MGEPDKIDLQAALENVGWRIKRHVVDDWRIHESWELTSMWRPVGATAFLTLLIDPQAKANDIASVWAIAVTPTRPGSRADAERFAIRVSPRWPDRMKEIVATANSQRPSLSTAKPVV